MAPGRHFARITSSDLGGVLALITVTVALISILFYRDIPLLWIVPLGGCFAIGRLCVRQNQYDTLCFWVFVTAAMSVRVAELLARKNPELYQSAIVLLLSLVALVLVDWNRSKHGQRGVPFGVVVAFALALMYTPNR